MKIIKYKVGDVGYCLTNCPKGFNSKVGSLACGKCKHNVCRFKFFNIVFCKDKLKN